MPTGHANRLMPTLRRVVLARESAARSDGDLLGAFVASRDADAFAELVRRHGPMVLGVCRRVSGEWATADDAFQATFLVLARRAAAVRPREQVGNWLYGVAYRTALKARMVLARRRSREKQVDVMPEPTAPAAPIAWGDLQHVIDEELAKLPAKLRVPVVLCDLEGRPQREVAKHLNVPPATLATRLASARRALAARLSRRGVTLSGGALAGLLCTHASASAVPPALATGLVRAAEAVATGAPLGSLVSANAVHLSEGVMRMMMLAKLKSVAVLAVTVLALTTGLGLGLVPASAGDQPGAPEPKAAAHEAHGARAKAPPAPEPGTDDATFLRRLCMNVRGVPPTDVETWFFVSDADDEKRTKVIEWMTDDNAAKAALAKKLGVPAERVKVVRVRIAEDGRQTVVVDGGKPDAVARTVTLSRLVEGKPLTVENTFRVQLGDKTTAGALVDWFNAGDQVKPVDPAHLRWLTLQVPSGNNAADATKPFMVWQPAPDGQKPSDHRAIINEVYFASIDSDAEFLKRVLTDVRGTGPTALETKYFTEDKDPKKREKLLDTLLKDPVVQKKLGESWKAKMLAAGDRTAQLLTEYRMLVLPNAERRDRLVVPFVAPVPPQPPMPPKVVVPVPPQPPKPPVPPTPPAPQADKYEKLVGELIAAQKSDEAILEALTLATLSRLPTDSEKKLTLAGIGNAKDRKAAWVAVAKALAGTNAKADVLRYRVVVEPKP